MYTMTTEYTKLSLRPYNGNLYVTTTKSGYSKASIAVFKDDGEPEDVIKDDMKGRMCIAEGHDGLWTYLVWAESPEAMAHELSHVVLHTFERCGINPVEAGGEPFCYMLGQLMEESLPLLKS